VAGLSDGNSLITKSSFEGTVKGVEAGGIVGRDYLSSTITSCYAVGSIKSETTESGGEVRVGGIAGVIHLGSIENCYAYCMVSSSAPSAEFAGGIAGFSDGIISKCYAAGTVKSLAANSSTTKIGGIIGGALSSYGGTVSGCMALVSEIDGGSAAIRYVHAICTDSTTTLTGNYSRNDITRSNADPGDAVAPSLTDKDGQQTPPDNFKTQALYTGAFWDFTAGTGDWKFIDGYDFPVLAWQTSPPPNPATLP
jgi:hypothetical protein